MPPAPEDFERSAPLEATIMQRKCRNKLPEGLACVKNDQNYSLSFWRSIILPSDPVTRTCLESLDFQGFQRIVQFRDISKEHVSRRAAKEPRCFLPWVQVHLGFANTSAKHVVRPFGATHYSTTIKRRRAKGGVQSDVSLLPPFYLFMAMTPWCA